MAMPTIVGVGTSAANTTATTAPLPAGGAIAGDIVLLFIETANQASPAIAGYADVLNSPQSVGTGTNPTRLTVRWHRAAGVETAAVAVGDSGDHQFAKTMIIRGAVATGNPWNVTVGATELVSDTTVSIPGLTTTVADCLVVAAFATGHDINAAQVSAFANASLFAVTERIDDWTGSGSGGGVAVATGEKAAAGAVSATTATVANANFKALFTMAVPGVSGTNVTATPAVIGATAASARPLVGVRAGPVAVAAATTTPASTRHIGAGPAAAAAVATLPASTRNVAAGPAGIARAAVLPQATAAAGTNATPAPAAAVASVAMVRPGVQVATGPLVVAAVAAMAQPTAGQPGEATLTSRVRMG